MNVNSSMQLTSIDQRNNLSVKEFESDYLRPGLPVVIKDTLTGWSAFNKWTPEFFRNTLGHKMVKINSKPMLLREFMEQVLASSEEHPSAYLNEVNIHEHFPELLKDITPDIKYALPDRLRSRLFPKKWGLRNGVLELLIGGKGTKFPTLHFDGFHMNTFITQIEGDKEFILYTPDQTPYMYPEKVDSNHSLVNDVHNPDLKRFPLFANAKPVKVTVGAGDTVFLPAGWWHTTRLLSLSIAVSTNNVCRYRFGAFAKDFATTAGNSPLKKMIFKNYINGVGMAMNIIGK